MVCVSVFVLVHAKNDFFMFVFLLTKLNKKRFKTTKLTQKNMFFTSLISISHTEVRVWNLGSESGVCSSGSLGPESHKRIRTLHPPCWHFTAVAADCISDIFTAASKPNCLELKHVSKYGLMSHSTDNGPFQRRVFSGYWLHQYWQPKTGNKTPHTQLNVKEIYTPTNKWETSVQTSLKTRPFHWLIFVILSALLDNFVQ